MRCHKAKIALKMNEININLGGSLLHSPHPLIMGILNVTRDSFYDGGRFLDLDAAMRHVEVMISQGADIIDIGAFSSRPGAQLVDAESQLAVLKPVIKEFRQSFPDVPLSVDCYHGAVVTALTDITAFLVNDVTGMSLDKDLEAAVLSNKLPYVLMHMRGKPEDMQSRTDYDDVVYAVLDYLARRVSELASSGLVDVFVDPGFGFSKTLEQNYEMLNKLNVFNILDRPIMVGLSRKSMIYKTLGNTAEEALNGTTALHMAALLNGAAILRVHDVKEAAETRNLWLQLQSSPVKQ